MISEISYGIVPVREGKILLLRVFDNWDFPKGKPEGTESPIETAIRELREESALINPQFLWGTEFAETAPYKKGKKVARYFIASCPTGDVQLLPNPEDGTVEHHGFLWLTIDDAAVKLPDRHAPVMAWIKSVLDDGKPN